MSRTKNLLAAILGAVFVTIVASPVVTFAELPGTQLTTIFPPGAKFGSELDVTVGGGDQDDLERLFFSHPGITAEQKINAAASEFEKPTPINNQFKIKIAGDGPPGIYEARVVGRFGVSNPRAFVVGGYDELIDGGVGDLMLVWAHLFDDRPGPGVPLFAARAQGRFVRDYFAKPRHGTLVPMAFRATPELYAGLGATPPELPPGLDDKAERLATMLAQLAAKGVRVCVFGYVGAGPDGLPTWDSEEARQAHRWDYVDARIQRIYGGTSEIMKEIIARDILGR